MGRGEGRGEGRPGRRGGKGSCNQDVNSITKLIRKRRRLAYVSDEFQKKKIPMVNMNLCQIKRGGAFV